MLKIFPASSSRHSLVSATVSASRRARRATHARAALAARCSGRAPHRHRVPVAGLGRSAPECALVRFANLPFSRRSQATDPCDRCRIVPTLSGVLQGLASVLIFVRCCFSRHGVPDQISERLSCVQRSAQTYLLDCYERNAASALASNVVLRSVCGTSLLVLVIWRDKASTALMSLAAPSPARLMLVQVRPSRSSRRACSTASAWVGPAPSSQPSCSCSVLFPLSSSGTASDCVQAAASQEEDSLPPANDSVHVLRLSARRLLMSHEVPLRARHSHAKGGRVDSRVEHSDLEESRLELLLAPRRSFGAQGGSHGRTVMHAIRLEVMSERLESTVTARTASGSLKSPPPARASSRSESRLEPRPPPPHLVQLVNGCGCQSAFMAGSTHLWHSFARNRAPTECWRRQGRRPPPLHQGASGPRHAPR